MITLNIPERTAQTILYCMNDAYDNSYNEKFKLEILQDKMRVKKGMCRAEGRSTKGIVDFRLQDLVKKYMVN